MLLSISIRNFLLIETLDLDFQGGFTVLTGETGAGKSILLDALGVLLGERFDQSYLRSKNLPLSLTACFTKSPHIEEFLSQNALLADDDIIVVRRVFDIQGKGKAFINDQIVTVALLKQFSPFVLDIHGQFDRFMTPQHYLNLVDQFGDLNVDVTTVCDAYKKWQKACKILEDSEVKKAHQQERLDDVMHDLSVLKKLAPKPNEEAQLLRERDTLKHAHHNSDALKQATQIFDHGILSHLMQLQKILDRCVSDGSADSSSSDIGHHEVAHLETTVQKGIMHPLASRMEQLIIELSDIESDVRSKAAHTDFDPAYLTTLDDRLHELRYTARKHKVTADELYRICDELEEESATLVSLDDTLDILRQDQKNTEMPFLEKAKQLHDKRVDVCLDLKKKVMAELPALKLDNALFDINITELPLDKATERGCDSIDFMFSANPGIPLQPMNKVASGGELSRLMLVLKVILSQSMGDQALIFDEIDSGVGGATASAIGARLKRLSKHQQVVAITHSPQVAAFADEHFKLVKSVKNEQTFVILEKKEDAARDEELARMLSGEAITDEAIKAAKSLKSQAVI